MTNLPADLSLPSPLAARASAEAERARARYDVAEATRRLEGLFLNLVFEEMAKTAPSGGLFGESPGQELAQGWLRTEISERWAKAGGTGLGSQMAGALNGHSPMGMMPVEGPISSDFGPRVHPVTGKIDHHEGVDIAVPTGTSVRLPFDGRVVEVKDHPNLGRTVVVAHAAGFRSVYGHLERAEVAPGQLVRKGDVIARSGATGRVTGPHLHFALYKNAEAVNPSRWIPELGPADQPEPKTRRWRQVFDAPSDKGIKGTD